MTKYCSVCGSTKGPFLEERFPAGVTSQAFLVRCQRCTSKFDLVTVENKAATKHDFAYNFSQCNNCKAVFYSILEGIPCAQSHFRVESCPQCRTRFPLISEVCIPRDSDGELSVLSFRLDEEALPEIKALYDKIVCALPQYPNLATVIREIMLVRAKGAYKSRGYEIWVVHIATTRGQDIVSHMLQKVMEKKFFLTGSKLLKFAKREEGLEVIESIKIEQDLQEDGNKPTVHLPQKKKKWWQIWK